MKREAPVLVILGNPPYNGFAGMAVDEERELSDAYRTAKRVRRPEGKGLNDLYVRFFRMAERRIAEKTGQGVVCFISNYSRLNGLSFTGMRERYMEAFDAVRIDCLNGDKYKMGKVAPDGTPDPSVFSTEGDPVGIQVGTAIATLVRKGDHTPAEAVGFRHLWGRSKRAELLASTDAGPAALYESIAPALPLGLPFMQTTVDDGWFDWPALPDLFPTSFPGGQTGRDGFLVDSDLDRLKARIGNYFDPNLRKDAVESQSAFTRCMGARHLIERGANWFPAWFREDTGRRPNLTGAARRYLDRMDAGAEDLFHHVLATLHDPAYREANAGALRMEWPRIPLPDTADALAGSAARGRELAALLDPETPVPGVTQAPPCPGLAAIAVPATTADRNMTGADFALTAGWGHLGAGGAVMPGQGRVTEHGSVFDVHLGASSTST